MDPLSITASSIAILQISGTIINICYKYRSGIANATKDASRIINELNGLRSIIESLFALLEDESNDKTSERSAFQKLADDDGPLKACEADLKALEKKLEPQEGWRAAQAMIFWPLKEADVKKALQNIERTKSSLQLALAADQRRTALATQGGVESLARQFSASSLDARREKIFQWLSPPNSLSRHTAARTKCQNMTGLWVLEEEAFKRWSRSTNSFLWIYGIPGCGKTILCSTIIDALLKLYRISQEIGLAYFYFDFNNSMNSGVDNLIRSIVAQLYAQRADTPDGLYKLFTRNQNGAFQPPLRDLLDVLLQMLAGFTKVYLVIDALDECVELEEMLQTFREIQSWKENRLLIIVTSRNVVEIDMLLSNVATDTICVQGPAVNKDISLYIAERLKTDLKLAKWPPQVREMIWTTLNGGARGMFRWVQCQLDALRNCYTIKDLKRELATLPKTLEETYEQILLRIDEDHREATLKILKWLSFAARPVTVQEASEILAVNLSEQPCYDPELKLLDPRDIMLLCSTLVTRATYSTDDYLEILPTYDDYHIDFTDSQVLRLAHLSVKDFLLSDRIKMSKASFFTINAHLAHSSMAQTCLVYLLQSSFASGYCDWRGLMDRLAQWPLYYYATHFWPFHVKASGDDLDNETWCLIDQLFETRNTSSGGNYVAWATALTPDISLQSAKRTNPLYYAASFGITSVIRKLLESGLVLDINLLGGRFNSTPLQVAVYRNHPTAVKLLLEFNADPMILNMQGRSCLLWAILRGHDEILRLLYDNGAIWTENDDSEHRAILEAVSRADAYLKEHAAEEVYELTLTE